MLEPCSKYSFDEYLRENEGRLKIATALRTINYVNVAGETVAESVMDGVASYKIDAIAVNDEPPKKISVREYKQQEYKSRTAKTGVQRRERPDRTQELINKIAAKAFSMYSSGVHVSDIARELSVSVATVYKYTGLVHGPLQPRWQKIPYLEHSKILEALESGTWVAEIAAIYKVSISSIYAVAEIYGVDMRRIRRERDLKKMDDATQPPRKAVEIVGPVAVRAFNLHSLGKSDKVIAKATGLSPGTVYRYRSMVHGPLSHWRKITHANYGKVAEMLKQGVTKERIAAQFGVSVSVIRNISIEIGLTKRRRSTLPETAHSTSRESSSRLPR